MPRNRTQISDIENIVIYGAASGQEYGSKNSARLCERFTPPTIERKDRERLITVSAVVDGVPMSKSLPPPRQRWPTSTCRPEYR